jgi:hypothetical protein
VVSRRSPCFSRVVVFGDGGRVEVMLVNAGERVKDGLGVGETKKASGGVAEVAGGRSSLMSGKGNAGCALKRIPLFDRKRWDLKSGRRIACCECPECGSNLITHLAASGVVLDSSLLNQSSTSTSEDRLGPRILHPRLQRGVHERRVRWARAATG